MQGPDEAWCRRRCGAGRRSKQFPRAVEQGSQGPWAKWDVPKRKVTWRVAAVVTGAYRITFLLRSMCAPLLHQYICSAHVGDERGSPLQALKPQGDSGTKLL